MYEFKEVQYIPTKQNITDVLRDCGKQGWKIATVLPLNYSSSAIGVHIVILQREIQRVG